MDIFDLQERSACARLDAKRKALFFSVQVPDLDRAREFCRRCRVREECLEFALTVERPKWAMMGGVLIVNARIPTSYTKGLAQKKGKKKGDIPPTLTLDRSLVPDKFEWLIKEAPVTIAAARRERETLQALDNVTVS